MKNVIFTLENIVSLVKPIAEKYHVDQIKLTMIFALAEDLREVLDKEVDVFEIHEINPNSEFYNTIMKERLLVA